MNKGQFRLCESRVTGRVENRLSPGRIYGVQIGITADTLSASAEGQLTVAAATATHELKETSEFKSNRFNFSEVTNPRVTGARIKDKVKLSQSESQRQAVVAEINVKDIALQSGGDTILVAPHIRAETLSITAGIIDGEVVNPKAQIQFLGVKESSSTSSSKNSHSFVHETVRDGGSSSETLKLPDIQLTSNATVDPQNPTKPAMTLIASGGIVVGATSLTPTQRELQVADSTSGTQSNTAKPPAGTIYDLQSQAQALAQQPGLAWLGELSQRKDVDWQKIELAQQSWDYKHAGLTKEGAAVVTIVVAIVTWGAGSALAGAEGGAVLGGSAEAGLTATATTTLGDVALSSTVTSAGVTTTTYTAVGAALNAGFTTLASQAAVSLINNQGDVGKTLQDLGSKESIKQLVAAMLTAGVGGYYANTYNLESFLAKTAAGCATGELTGSGCGQGAVTAGVTQSAAGVYNATVGYDAKAGPGTNSEDPFYEEGRDGRQPSYSVGNNIIGLNDQKQANSLLAQGSTLSKTLNLIPFINATAGFHDYIFNVGWLKFTPLTNVGTMLPSSAIAIPASLNDPSLKWIIDSRLFDQKKKDPQP